MPCHAVPYREGPQRFRSRWARLGEPQGAVGLPCHPGSPRSAPQLFSGDVLKMFSTDCKRMSAEIFDQTMPLGKHWRVGLRTGG